MNNGASRKFAGYVVLTPASLQSRTIKNETARLVAIALLMLPTLLYAGFFSVYAAELIPTVDFINPLAAAYVAVVGSALTVIELITFAVLTTRVIKRIAPEQQEVLVQKIVLDFFVSATALVLLWGWVVNYGTTVPVFALQMEAWLVYNLFAVIFTVFAVIYWKLTYRAFSTLLHLSTVLINITTQTAQRIKEIISLQIR